MSSPKAKPGKSNPRRERARSVKVEIENGKAYVPTKLDRETAQTLAAAGLDAKQIAVVMGIGSDNTIRKYFGDEILKGKLLAGAKCVQSLFTQATKQSNTTAGIWLTKNLLGWTDREHRTGAGSGKPQTININFKHGEEDL